MWSLLAANKRLNTAYVLKESFGQLWSYEREGWARRFFENWRASPDLALAICPYV
jgi:transposase